MVVFCWGGQQILARGFYALQDTLTPAIMGTCTTLAVVPVFFFLTRYFDAAGTAWASALGVGLYTMVLSLWWQHRFGKDTFAGLGKTLLTVAAFSLVASGPATLITRLCFPSQNVNPYAAAFVAIIGSGFCFALIFMGLSVWLAPSLVQPFLEKARIQGRKPLR
jgi:putative peptidoglycan lipid II flippase